VKNSNRPIGGDADVDSVSGLGPNKKGHALMWKVVITEIQDASALEPFDLPAGAFFVSKERFARTVANLDLARLIDVLEAMQSPQEYAREARPVSSQGTPSNRNSLRAKAGPETHRLNRRQSRPTVVITQFLSKNSP
jgi:hypothetical protein